jgi:hypothetical protein
MCRFEVIKIWKSNLTGSFKTVWIFALTFKDEFGLSGSTWLLAIRVLWSCPENFIHIYSWYCSMSVGGQKGSMWNCRYGTCLRMRTNKTKEMPCIPTNLTHACPHHGPWAACIRLGHEKAQCHFPTLTEKHRSSRIVGGWRRVDNQTQNNYFSRNPKREARFHIEL